MPCSTAATATASSLVSNSKLLFLALLPLFVCDPNVAILADSDESILLKFKSSVDDQSGILSPSNYFSWLGVMCDLNSRVVLLNITGGKTNVDNGNGTLNFICCDSYQIPFYGFGVMRYCDGQCRHLEGKLIPLISNLTKRQILSLPFNGLVGEITNEIWSMEKLEVLDLENNRLSGLLAT